MSQFYIDPNRAENPHALPDGETVKVYPGDDLFDNEGEPLEPGWYWWACFPGCLPDSELIGPFSSEKAAIANAQAEFLEE